ncbi:MAG: hypothetical protein E6G11_10890 [Actinobacteria bacterium]|nr:MAG: hypothetical protein E6G11_10890 [Actinomycetota bacterium]
MELVDELDRIASLASEHGDPDDVVSAVLPTEADRGRRIYLCAFDGGDGFRSWLAVDGEGKPIASRAELRGAVSIAALCEVAAEAAGGGALDELVARLEELRSGEGPPGIDAALEAARALRGALGEPPQLASPARLDEIGEAARRLERELDPIGSSPFGAAMQSSQAAVAELQREIEAGYRVSLDK